MDVTTKHTGKISEDIAVKYLEQNNLKIIERNFECKFGEIDIIGRTKETLVFVEVRYKQDTINGHPVETVNVTKQRKIIKVAKIYLMKYGLTDKINCRFDIIAMTGNINNPHIDWYIDAFWGN